MRILALDTATEACSVAVWNNGTITHHGEVCPREHTQKILPMVQDILDRSGLTLAQCDALAFGRGPGSFTGVRIGVGIAQGLALGAALPLLGISTLMTLAEGARRVHGAHQVLTAIDARMDEVYWAAWRYEDDAGWQAVQAEAVLSPEQAHARIGALEGEWFTAGSGWDRWPNMANGTKVIVRGSEITLPDARDMLPLAIRQWEQGATLEVAQAEPVYLRNEVAWRKLPGRG